MIQNKNIAIYMRVIISVICEWFLHNLGIKSKREKERYELENSTKDCALGQNEDTLLHNSAILP